MNKTINKKIISIYPLCDGVCRITKYDTERKAFSYMEEVSADEAEFIYEALIEEELGKMKYQF